MKNDASWFEYRFLHSEHDSSVFFGLLYPGGWQVFFLPIFEKRSHMFEKCLHMFFWPRRHSLSNLRRENSSSLICQFYSLEHLHTESLQLYEALSNCCVKMTLHLVFLRAAKLINQFSFSISTGIQCCPTFCKTAQNFFFIESLEANKTKKKTSIKP